MKKEENMPKPLLDVLQGHKVATPPVWLMRQAGRYLPEYRRIREQEGGFLDMCDNPQLASDVTLQPIHRYNFDGAIIFADILLLPRALGQDVWFEPGVGPKLTPLTPKEAVAQLAACDFTSENNTFAQKLAPVGQALSRTKAHLPPATTLLGFCGAPWTVACYMLNGEGAKDWAYVRSLAYQNPQDFAQMLSQLAQASAAYLAAQVAAGADAVQIFDSWAGAVPPQLEEMLIVNPVLELARAFKAKCPDTPLILFSKNSRQEVLETFAQSKQQATENAHTPPPAQLSQTQLSQTQLFACLGLDEQQDLRWAVRALTPHVAIQGNLDNALLLTTPAQIRTATKALLDDAQNCGRYIANLGHGVIKETPTENVSAFVETVRGIN